MTSVFRITVSLQINVVWQHSWRQPMCQATYWLWSFQADWGAKLKAPSGGLIRVRGTTYRVWSRVQESLWCRLRIRQKAWFETSSTGYDSLSKWHTNCTFLCTSHYTAMHQNIWLSSLPLCQTIPQRGACAQWTVWTLSDRQLAWSLMTAAFQRPLLLLGTASQHTSCLLLIACCIDFVLPVSGEGQSCLCWCS
jgi:hypothetical protein